MRIEIVEDAAALGRRTADLVSELARRKPACAIGLPSGATPAALYAELTRRVRGGEIDLSQAGAFAIDEFYGIPRGHPATNASYFREHLSPLALRAVHVLDSESADTGAECARFLQDIAAAGGLDLAVLGIGVNGHIAFNEPGAAFDSRARPVELAEPSREAYATAFGGIDRVPARGLTLGIADLMASRQVVLLASGAAKAAIVARALEGPLTEAVPASALQLHPNATALFDRAAAAEMRGYAAE
jgi:glucosamine-6-phosphate deaminase